jgi:hypothetical protein
MELTTEAHVKLDEARSQEQTIGNKMSAEVLQAWEESKKEIEKLDKLLEEQHKEILAMDKSPEPRQHSPVDLERLRTPELNREFERQRHELTNSPTFKPGG